MTYDRSAALENLKSRHVGAPPPRIPSEIVVIEETSEDEAVVDPADAASGAAPVEAPVELAAVDGVSPSAPASSLSVVSDPSAEVTATSTEPTTNVTRPHVIQIGPEHDGLYALRSVPPSVARKPSAVPDKVTARRTTPSPISAEGGSAQAAATQTGGAIAEEDRLPGWARKSGQRQLVCDLALDADAALTRGRTTGERNADTLVRALAMTADELVTHFIEEKTKPLSRGFVLVTPHKRPPRAQQTRRVTFQLSPQNAQALQALAVECSTENLTKVVETALMLAFPASQKQRPT
jgi:hypothetical protein